MDGVCFTLATRACVCVSARVGCCHMCASNWKCAAEVLILSAHSAPRKSGPLEGGEENRNEE